MQDTFGILELLAHLHEREGFAGPRVEALQYGANSATFAFVN